MSRSAADKRCVAVDPLLVELLAVANNEDEEVELRESYTTALAKVLLSGGKNISETSRESLISYLDEQLESSVKSENLNSANAQILAALLVAHPAALKPLVV